MAYRPVHKQPTWGVRTYRDRPPILYRVYKGLQGVHRVYRG